MYCNQVVPNQVVSRWPLYSDHVIADVTVGCPQYVSCNRAVTNCPLYPKAESVHNKCREEDYWFDTLDQLDDGFLQEDVHTSRGEFVGLQDEEDWFDAHDQLVDLAVTGQGASSTEVEGKVSCEDQCFESTYLVVTVHKDQSAYPTKARSDDLVVDINDAGTNNEFDPSTPPIYDEYPDEDFPSYDDSSEDDQISQGHRYDVREVCYEMTATGAEVNHPANGNASHQALEGHYVIATNDGEDDSVHARI